MKKLFISILFAGILFVNTNAYAVSCEEAKKIDANGKYDPQINAIKDSCKSTNDAARIQCEKGNGLDALIAEKEEYLNNLLKECDDNNGPSAKPDSHHTGNSNEDEETPTWLSAENKVRCGNLKPFSATIPKVTSRTVTVFTIISMALLVMFGTVDFFKATMSGSEDNIKKNQKAFIDRIIAAILLFAIVLLTKFLVSFATTVTGGGAGIIDCVNCFISNKCTK